jgi:hypothetical protein
MYMSETKSRRLLKAREFDPKRDPREARHIHRGSLTSLAREITAKRNQTVDGSNQGENANS